MNKRLLPVFLVLFSVSAHAQYLYEESRLSEIYSLTSREARAIIVEGVAFDTAWLHSPLGTSDTLDLDELPSGYYLTLRAMREAVVVDVLVQPAFGINLLPTRRDLALVITDFAGKRIDDAQVTINGKKVRFNKKMQCYRRAGRKRGGTLEVKSLGRTFFYDIDVTEYENPMQMRWQRFTARPFGRTVTVPVRTAQNLWRIIRHHNNFDDFIYHLKYRRASRLNAKEAWNGYVAFSQPTYKPGDTMQVKAWITDHRNRPWNKPVEMKISQRYTGEPVRKRLLSPVSPGVFTWQMPLADSFEIDRYHFVTFKNPKPRKRGLFRQFEPESGTVSGNFYYEDYQLDEISYDFTQDRKHYAGNDSIVFHLSARDATGQSVADGHYKLVVITTGLTQFYDAQVTVPDTLWVNENAIDATGAMDIRIPDRFLPNASYNAMATVYVTGSSGELQQRSLSFSVDRFAPRFSAKIDTGWLLISENQPGGAPTKAVLEQYYPQADMVQRDTIELPYKMRVRPEVNEYIVRKNKDILTFYPNDASSGGHGISAAAFRSGDTVICVVQNPNSVPIQYVFWRNKKEWEKGVVSDATWTGRFVDSEGHDIRARFVFIWGGEEKEISTALPYYENHLNVDIEQPEEVAPGQHAQVKISVKTRKGKPAAGVDLTAGAYNALFKGSKPYGAPNIKVKRKPYPLWYNPFEISVLSGNRYSFPLSEKWYDRLHLDTIPYYQLLHVQAQSVENKPAAFAVSRNIRSNVPRMPVDDQEPLLLPDLPREGDSFYFNRPQLAPYVVKNYHSEPIYLIWLNKKLVYFHEKTDNQPYSFYGEYGYNSLRIRTRKSEYVVDSLWLEKGEKLIFSIPADAWNLKATGTGSGQKALLHTKVAQLPRPDSLTATERSYLNQSFLLLRRQRSETPQILWDDVTNIHIADLPNKLHIIGPFTPGSQINALVPGRFLSRFRFDPGFEYEIQPNRERLYASNWANSRKRFPITLPVKSPNEWAIGPFHINRYINRYKFAVPENDKPGLGSLLLKLGKKAVNLKGIVLRDSASNKVYAPATMRWNGLKPGTYSISLYTFQHTILEETIVIRRDTVLCLDFSEKSFRPLLPKESFDALFLSSRQEIDPVLKQSNIYYKPADSGGFVIEGKITDADGEPLIGATVLLRQGGELVRGAVTNIDGVYRCQALPGAYEIVVSYTGYTSQRADVSLFQGDDAVADFVMMAAEGLQEVVVTAYKVPLIQMDATSAGISVQDIRNLPTRSVNSIVATTSGTTSIDGGAINIRGSRSTGTEYYVDGIRVAGEPPLQGTEAFSGAGLRSTFRDYAYWQPVLQTDANGEAVFQVTFPDDLTTWEAYAVAADKKGRAGVGNKRTRSFKPLTAQLAVPRFAVAGDVFDVSGRLVNRRQDSVAVSTRFLLNNKVLQEKTHRILQGMAEYVQVTIPATDDTTLINYELVSGELNDGEQRKIPVLPVGTLHTEGQFFVLESDTSFALTFPAGPHPLTIHAEKNELDLMLEDIDYLRSYPYGCNEQTSSRLIALLSFKKICQLQHKPFLHEKDIQACLKKLKSTQLSDGSWGWWAEGTRNYWMTLYVAKALASAQNMGYQANGLNEALNLLRLALPVMPAADRANTLILLRESNVNIDCTPYLQALDTMRFMSLANRLNLLKMRQLCGQEVKKDSLLSLLRNTTFGGMYVGEEHSGWYDRRAVLTLEAHRIAQAAGWTDITRGIERYWLQSRAERRNTIETAQILEALLPVLLAKTDTIRPIHLRINGQETVEFPFTQRLDLSNAASISVSKTGDGPVFFTAYQRWHDPSPAARSDLFEVNTRMLLENETPVQALRYGEPALLEVTVHVKSAADYVMIEVPIPAGCGYGYKVQKGWPEVHREYFKDRTAIFCERLPVGTHVFSIPLEPRFTGSFTLNPTRVEQMYFPVFFGRNQTGKVEVIGR